MSLITAGHMPYAIGLLIGLVVLFGGIDQWARHRRDRRGTWIGLGAVAAVSLLFTALHLAFGDRAEAFLGALVTVTLGLNCWLSWRRVRRRDAAIP